MKLYKYKKSGLADALFAKMNSALGYRIGSYDEIIDFVDNGESVGIVSINYAQHEVWLDIYAPNFQLTRQAIKDFFEYAFELRPRCSCIVAQNNARCRCFLEKLGFVKEGELRKQFDGVQNAIYYGMLKEDFLQSKWA